jgi:hypothetical protein
MDGVDEIFEAATRQAMLVRSTPSHNPSSSMNATGGEGDKRKGTYDNGKTAGEQSKGCCIIL